MAGFNILLQIIIKFICRNSHKRSIIEQYNNALDKYKKQK